MNEAAPASPQREDVNPYDSLVDPNSDLSGNTVEGAAVNLDTGSNDDGNYINRMPPATPAQVDAAAASPNKYDLRRGDKYFAREQRPDRTQ